MATILFFLFITLFPLVFPRSLEEQNRQFLNPCHPVKCGKLGEIKFPFTNTSIPTKCGAFLVDGCSKKDQRIQLQNGTGRWYDVKHFSHANATILVTDKEFKKRIASNSCEVFNMSLPNLPYASFQINPGLHLHKCNVGIDKGEVCPHAYCYSCNGFNIYYGDKIPHLPSSCSLLQLPGTEDDKLDIFHWLTAEFSIQVHFDNDSYQQYISNGQSSPPTSHEASKGNKNLVGEPVVALAIGCSTFIAVICLLIFFIRHRNKNNKYAPSDFFYANSPDPPLSLELECTACLGVSIFSYAELEEATNNFDREKKLANGGFGTVYYGKFRDEREVAVKRLNENNPKKVKQFLNEIAILTRIRHPNLVKLYGCTIHQSHNLLLVYEYVPNGTVADHLHGLRNTSNALNWPTRMRIAIETATALAHLHASGIIHRDVSTRNILLDENLCVKVADFGLSRLVPEEMSHVSTTPQGSPGYLDPGYYYCCRLSDKSDVYSFGVVLSELISSQRAFDTNRHQDEIHLGTFALNRIQKCAFDELIDRSLGYKTNEEVTRMTTSVAELAFLCLQQDTEMRPRMEEVLEQLKGIQSWGKNGCSDASQKEDEGPIEEDALLKSTRLPRPSISETAECSPWKLCCTLQTEAECSF